MQLEIKELHPYLLSNLKVQYFGSLIGQFAGYMEDMPHNPIRILYNGQDNENINAKMESEIFLKLEDIKPILRHPSAFKFSFDYNGENIVPLLDFFNTDEREMYEFTSSKVPLFLNYPYTMWVQLFEWNIDLFGLIERGLAIDLHTLSGRS